MKFEPKLIKPSIKLRAPVAEDAAQLNQLVRDCAPLDSNSLYCNLLHCTHFSATSVAAVRRDRPGEPLVGFISAYIPPEKPDTLFIWQVAVAAQARHQGLGRRMLDAIVERPVCDDIQYLDTTINPGNDASWALFESWADRRDAPTHSSLHFERERHFDGRHEDEMLLRIGPLERADELVAV